MSAELYASASHSTARKSLAAASHQSDRSGLLDGKEHPVGMYDHENTGPSFAKISASTDAGSCMKYESEIEHARYIELYPFEGKPATIHI